jgi:trk system potassium uptake protein
MFYKQIIKILGAYLYIYSAVLIIPLILAIYYQFGLVANDHPQPHSTVAFSLTLIISLFTALLCHFFTRNHPYKLHRQEALATVLLIWIVTPLIGSLPFFLSGTLERFDQAYFESFSGFTTTGATLMDGKQFDPVTGLEVPIIREYSGIQKIKYEFFGTIHPVIDPNTGRSLEGLEAVGKAVLFWRSFTQWLGGIGIIVIFIALLPALGIGSKTLFQTETSGLSKEGIAPRIKDTAMQLLKIYGGLTLIQILILSVADPLLPTLDILTLTFSTVSLGGFSIHNENLAYYHSGTIEWIVFIFIILCSLNFSLYHSILKGKFYRIFDNEFILYISLLLIFGTFVSWQLIGWENRTFSGDAHGVYSIPEAIRYGFFQLVSAQTSAGFFTDDYDHWPASIQILLLIAMYLGGMAGSTAGGIKMIRVYYLFQVAKNKIESIFRPDTVRSIILKGQAMDSKTIISILCFFFIVVSFSLLGSFLYILDGIDVDTAYSLTGAMITNTGIGLRAAGPTSTVAFLTPFSTWLSCFLMLLGRLEFYAVLIVLIPDFWKGATDRQDS